MSTSTPIRATDSPTVEAALDAMLAYGRAVRAYCLASDEFTSNRSDDYTLVDAAMKVQTDAQNTLHRAIYAVHETAAGITTPKES